MSAWDFMASLRRAALAALLVACSAALLAQASAGADAMRREKLELAIGPSRYPLSVEIAESPAEKARGLMFRRALADNEGMLFLYSEPQEVTMWMRNTYLPLDMVFIAKDGTVTRIAESTTPFSEEQIASEGPVLAVLEIKGGLAEKLGLKPGDRLLHAAFGAVP
jgi:uncharacterized membrane protein (UPF0127 family)